MRNGLILWVRADNIEDSGERHRTVLESVQRGYSEIVVRQEDLGLTSAANFIPIVLDAGNILIEGRRAGRHLTINSPDDMPGDDELEGEFLIVETGDWKVIPLENLIAQCSARKVKLIASVKSTSEARLFVQTLEKGVDGLLITPMSHSGLSEFTGIGEEHSKSFALEEAEVISVNQAGMGDRVCVDTCSLLELGEGMLIGSQSSVSFLVHSETLDTRYVNSRPFRVNAGPVHSYIVLPDGKTGYLSELSSGREILAVRRDGSSRNVTVGRVKIERRPLLLVQAKAAGKECSIILQNAETVCLCSRKGVLPVTSVKKGDQVLVHVEQGGRHFGMKIDETIHER